ncbi:hypothetical protein DEH18_11030 [Streptomyces sp. NHF165]|uniref:hypothetical protein n=1 Tax=unclassified Streptomyces TaxID=2593676 RepID=UPI0004CA1C2D|nr:MULTISPECIES: hypothetical protein [unclassified Streptomyces]QHF94294.1 hypothetical protein DEH18_11030 [Streptomyces sp. NHF165]
MRLRTCAATGLGAVALALTLATPAGATTGDFAYTYGTPDGPRQQVLHDLPSRECVTLPQAASPGTPPAHSPRNRTGSTAVAFTGPDCTGEHFSMRPGTGYGSERLKLRSVLLS